MSNGNRPRVLGAITFAATFTAVSCSRAFIRRVLTQVGVDYLVDDVELAVSELVTNSVKATGLPGPCRPWTGRASLALIKLRVTASASSLFLEVWDRDATPPRPQLAADDDECGRGLLIVSRICERWECHYPSAGGKIIRAEFSLKPADPARSPRPGRAIEP